MDERQILWLFYFLLGIVVLVVLLQYINSVIIGTDFDKNYLIRDSALILNTIYFSPGQVSLEYPYDKKYDLYIKDGYVGVYNGVKLEYPYFESKDIEVYVENGILKIRKK